MFYRPAVKPAQAGMQRTPADQACARLRLNTYGNGDCEDVDAGVLQLSHSVSLVSNFSPLFRSRSSTEMRRLMNLPLWSSSSDTAGTLCGDLPCFSATQLRGASLQRGGPGIVNNNHIGLMLNCFAG